MNVLYKYCDQLGAVKILGSLELKLPDISQVNDPIECLPFLYCPNNKAAMEAKCLRTLESININLLSNLRKELKEKIRGNKFPKKLLINGLRKHIDDMKQRSFLLSVSQEARNTVMWAHYADKHKGAVIGIDFNKSFPNNGIKMYRVGYSNQRPKMNVLDSVEGKKYVKILLTKSADWSYEKEFRRIFLVDDLGGLQRQGLARLKNFNGKKTWFLRLNPESIREVVFGLYTEESLKSAIRKLIERPELQHVKLYQAGESETYTLKLVEIKR